MQVNESVKGLFTAWFFMILGVAIAASIAFVGFSVLDYFNVEMNSFFGFVMFASIVITALIALVATLKFHDSIVGDEENGRT